MSHHLNQKCFNYWPGKIISGNIFGTQIDVDHLWLFHSRGFRRTTMTISNGFEYCNRYWLNYIKKAEVSSVVSNPHLQGLINSALLNSSCYWRNTSQLLVILCKIKMKKTVFLKMSFFRDFDFGKSILFHDERIDFYLHININWISHSE